MMMDRQLHQDVQQKPLRRKEREPRSAANVSFEALALRLRIFHRGGVNFVHEILVDPEAALVIEVGLSNYGLVNFTLSTSSFIKISLSI